MKITKLFQAQVNRPFRLGEAFHRAKQTSCPAFIAELGGWNTWDVTGSCNDSENFFTNLNRLRWVLKYNNRKRDENLTSQFYTNYSG